MGPEVSGTTAAERCAGVECPAEISRQRISAKARLTVCWGKWLWVHPGVFRLAVYVL